MINMGGNTQHLAAVAGDAWVAELSFKGGLQRLTTAPVTLTVDGQAYQGLGSLAEVPAVTESPQASAERLVLSLSLADPAMLAASLGNVDDYRGRSVRLGLVLLDAAFQAVGSVRWRWAGVMERVVITRQAADLDSPGAEASGRIELHCTRSGMSRARNDQGLRLTHAQQQRRHPGDTGLRYMRTLIEQPSLWLSKRFQEQ
ncbi:MAG: hypothetical protein LCH73_02960 [Proteobacteria bacterium]|nr:hypothetical protein [Pseudomonadota bacterium]